MCLQLVDGVIARGKEASGGAWGDAFREGGLLLVYSAGILKRRSRVPVLRFAAPRELLLGLVSNQQRSSPTNSVLPDSELCLNSGSQSSGVPRHLVLSQHRASRSCCGAKP